HSKFIVHAGDVNVEVLGTQFNVWQRQNKTRVVLDEGKVKLSRTETNQSVIMRPGELVEASESQPALVQKTVRTPVYTAWKENRLVFEDATLGEIARMIEDNYGYRVQLTHPQLRSRKFSYTLYENDLDLLLSTLAESLDLSVRKQDHTILIESKNP
ncbi:MAG: DUF4974 domain-containing protein, partial [Cytophagales bacterium]|nr:DUF4974 domain-containing protein [Cytophagales bacterium]